MTSIDTECTEIPTSREQGRGSRGNREGGALGGSREGREQGAKGAGSREQRELGAMYTWENDPQ